VVSGRAEVVIVGGGIGGAALAYALAGAGLDVTVLEATTAFSDRVRGESMQPWGVAEAQALGVEGLLLAAGAHITPAWKAFGGDGSEVMEIPMSAVVPGVGGSLNLRHPVACQALLDGAAAAGAQVVRGVADVRIAGGSSPRVSYACGDAVVEVDAGLVIGADGRGSTVRRQAGITLQRQEPVSYIAGLLVEGLDVPDDHDLMVSDEGLFSLLFHQGGGRARTYLCPGLSGQHRFAGRSGAQHFLEACAGSVHPSVAAVAEATVAGPCAAVAGDDTWTETPYADGVVLIGDAAGHNDPVVGQGLSIALRDARIVRDLVLDGARVPEALAPYGQERTERMDRLRLIADIVAIAQAEDADNQKARREFVAEQAADPDSGLLPLLAGAHTGPEVVPADAVDHRWPDRIRAA
jgi:2-polyprenyl-6-methoxyphenol hydroxylase-like FAD-dependent oxidoreductase